MFLLDTDICVYLINKKSTALINKVTAISSHEIALSSITLAELNYGAEKSEKKDQNRQALEQFVIPFNILPFDVVATKTYGIIRASLEKQGKPIGALDFLIAAHALSLNAVLVTNNTKEFSRVPHLTIENWVS